MSDPIKQAIKQIMLYHGRTCPISRRQLLQELELPVNSTNDRRLRELILELRRGNSLEEPFPILPCGNGYYLPATNEEKDMGIEKYKSYIIDACITLRALKRGGTRYVEGAGQKRMI